MTPLMPGFAPVFGSLAPIFALIALGYGMRRAGFPGEAFWPPAERLTYYVLFPALLIRNLATAGLGEVSIGPMAGAFVIAFLVVSALLLAIRSRLRVDGPGFSSVFQGSIRMNTYVGIAAAVALYGPNGLTLAAVAIAVIIPLVNVLSVTVLCRFAPSGTGGWGQTLGNVARNPLILACALGAVLNASGLGLPYGSARVFEILGRASLAIGLLAVGAGLELGLTRSEGAAVGASCVFKLLLLPCLAALACGVLGVGGPARGIVVLFSARPSSVSSYILARQLGGDATLMATILTVQTLLAAATLPLALVYLA